MMVKKILNAFIKWSSQATPKLKPIKAQIIRAARETHAQKPPENITDIPTHVEEVFFIAPPLPEQIIYEFENVFVSWNGIVIRGFHLFVPSLAFFTYEEEYSGVFLLRQWISKKTKLNKTVGLVYDDWSAANYYHWLVDTLPRLLLLRKKYPDCTLLVPASAPNYVSLTIGALGFRNTFPIAKDSFVEVRHLVMPSHITHPGYQEPDLIQSVRKELLTAFGQPTTIASSVADKRIYVSRSRQKTRHLINEEEILPLLLHYNFEIVYFEEMGFEQQVKTMQNAKVMMGVHGANLTNILFMSSGSQLIELLNGQVPNPCYFQLASNLELSYKALLCYPSLGSGPVNNHDVSVDIISLSKILESL